MRHHRLIAFCLAWAGSSVGVSSLGLVKIEAQEPIVHFMGIADTSAVGIGPHVSAALSKVATAVLGRIPENRKKEHASQIDADCEIEKIMTSVRNLEMSPGDTVVVYYAGHGGFDPQNGTLLLPTRNPGQGLRLQGIGMELEKKQPRLIIFLVDCCQTPVNGLPPSVPRTLTNIRSNEVPPLEQSLFFDSEPGKFILFAAQRGVAVPCGIPQSDMVSPGTLFSEAIEHCVLRSELGAVGWVEFGKRVKARVNENFAKHRRDDAGRLILSPGDQRVNISSQRVWALHVNSNGQANTLIEP